MMEKNWTPIPWEIEHDNDTGQNDEGFWEWYQVGPAKVDIYRSTRTERDTAKEDAERIKSCVEACDNIPKPEGLGEAIWALKEIRRTHKLEPFDMNEAELATLHQTVWAIAGSALRACGIPLEGEA